MFTLTASVHLSVSSSFLLDCKRPYCFLLIKENHPQISGTLPAETRPLHSLQLPKREAAQTDGTFQEPGAAYCSSVPLHAVTVSTQDRNRTHEGEALEVSDCR